MTAGRLRLTANAVATEYGEDRAPFPSRNGASARIYRNSFGSHRKSNGYRGVDCEPDFRGESYRWPSRISR